MEQVKITFLGTGSAIPTKLHNHPAILASFANENILIDCGEGTQRQFRQLNLSPTKLTRILITHWHGDHILGLPGLFQTLALSNYGKTLKLYGPKGTKRNMQLMEELFFNQKYYKINLEIHEVEQGIIINEKDFQVVAGSMSHTLPTLAYSLILKDKIRLDKVKLKKLKLPNSPLIGQLIQGKDIIFNKKKIKSKDIVYKDKGKKITFILDTAFNQNAINIAKGSDLIITECEFSNEEQAKAQEYKHMSSKDAASIAKQSKSKQLILTHLSQRYEYKPKIIETEAKKVFKNVKIVKDFDTIKI